MALKHITLHVTRQESDVSGRRKTVRVKVAATDVPELSGGRGMRSVPLLLTHALSVGGEGVTERMGFDYLFREPVSGDAQGGGFVLGEEAGLDADIDTDAGTETLKLIERKKIKRQ